MLAALIKAYPAYGRTYADPKAVEQDFLQGKDFSVSRRGGPYFSIRDFVEGGYLEDFVGIIYGDQVYTCANGHLGPIVAITRPH